MIAGMSRGDANQQQGASFVPLAPLAAPYIMDRRDAARNRT